jgi:5-formyltetrahydrofolate cyclo-ligase
MTDNVADIKANLRNQVLSGRTVEMSELTAEAIGDQLMNLCRNLNARTVGTYLSFGSEPATDAFVVKAVSTGITLASPRTGPDSTMEFGLLEGPTTLNQLGFLQPVGEIVEPEDIDLIIAPALSVDFSGARLGRGGGFFDRYLEEFTGPVAAVVYETELVDSLPTQDHDKAVSFVVTPARILELPAKR